MFFNKTKHNVNANARLKLSFFMYNCCTCLIKIAFNEKEEKKEPQTKEKVFTEFEADVRCSTVFFSHPAWNSKRKSLTLGEEFI